VPEPKDIILALETSNPSAVEGPGSFGVALARADFSQPVPAITDHLVSEPLALQDPHHDDLMACVQRACTRARITPRQIARIHVSVGPGGFTAVRIAVVCAKLIAEVTGAQCVAVPSAWVVARSMQDRVQGGFAVALASKGETAHITYFPGLEHSPEPGILMDAPALAALCQRLPCGMLVADRFLPEAMRVSVSGLKVILPEFQPLACAYAGLTLSPCDPVVLAPIYAREPEAVTKWRARHAQR
jgi:tRNA A37 threonylcarbamoyladenosine modification protein TsaB